MKIPKKVDAVMQQGHATLEYLSGNTIGTKSWLSDNQIDISFDDSRLLGLKKTKETSGEGFDENVIARLSRTGGTYWLQTSGSEPVWLNGRQVDIGELIDGDIIKFGEVGSLSAYRFITGPVHRRHYFSEFLVDCWNYIQPSREPVSRRMENSVGGSVHWLVSETTLWFRGGVILTLGLLGIVAFQQYNINKLQQERLLASQGQMGDFSKALARNRQEAISSSDLAQFRDALSRDLSKSLSRLEALEEQSNSTETVINKSAPSVVFLQGAYRYREASTGRPVRRVMGPDGQPLTQPNGQPVLSLDGDGPIVERRQTGTGFAIADGTILVTNRHVAFPWKADGSESLVGKNIEPFMVKFMAYSTSSPEGRCIEVIRASEIADLALLRLTSPENPLPPLRIADGSVAHGAPVIVMGYPTGFNSMLARSGKAFVDELQKNNVTSFWQVAHLLAKKGFIKPLSSLGIVAQFTNDFLVYDAATSQGGSGGPVLNSRGEIVAINAAILPDYAGSNLGVRSEKLRELIAETGAEVPTHLAQK